MKCPLYDVRIFDRFPADCPLKSLQPAQEVNGIQDMAYGLMDPQSAAFDVQRGTQLLAKHRTCSHCFHSALADPTVQLARRALA